MATSAWNGRNASRGLSRFGRPVSSVPSVGLTPESSANVGFAPCAVRLGTACSVKSDDSFGFSVCGGPAGTSRRGMFSDRPSPRSRIAACCDIDAPPAAREARMKRLERETNVPMHPSWRMHGHIVQSEQPLWSENVGYPHVRRVAGRWKGSRLLGRVFGGLDVTPPGRWRRSSEP